MATAIVFDTEVNSLDSKECIELAWVELTALPYKDYLVPLTSRITSAYYRPQNKIEAGAIAVHGILPQHVENCPPSSEANLPESDYVIGHHVDFDCEVLGVTKQKRICTLALSRYLWPEYKSHSLSAMIIELMGATPRTLREIKNAHSAAVDVRLTLILIHWIKRKTEIDDFEELYQLSEVARIPTVMPFGKHKDTPIQDLPPDYVRWLRRDAVIDDYLKKALDTHHP